jgi:hypothetical protein
LKLHLLLLAAFSALSLQVAQGQIKFSDFGVVVGGGYSHPENEVIPNQQNTASYHLGYSTVITDSSRFPNWSVQPTILFNRRGYNQVFDQTYRFRYMSSGLQLLVKHRVFSRLTLQFGAEICGIDPETDGSDDSDIYERYNIYSGHEVALVAGLQTFSTKRVSVYTQYVYGLTPLLHYQKIDKYGNFQGSFQDIYTRTLQAGLRIKIWKND